ncbi:hypothetical protein JK358_35950 [Nocardia sp. 2]|uniref:TY-Chap N-terminal domain-containing protein n=1 Tax=Nocardia acididurans TaxID=2802282 RepID=A0ABS1MID8_9NOCA|nr:hypothetical protein [Nocardia acididurans]MBL1079810.1 hypothetical protein [Nocardia acididurans]
MREGLSMNPANLRSSIWTRTGPRLQPSWGLFSLTESDRPTARDADSRCQDWDDFTHRLEWTLTTLPVGAVLILESPSDTGTPHLIQFKHERTLRGLAVLQRRHGDTTDHHDRMADLGWHHAPDLILSNTAQTWTDAGHCEQPNLPHHCAVRAATTLREIFHTAQPSQLSCRTRSNNGVETGYITTELGLHAPNTPLPIR